MTNARPTELRGQEAIEQAAKLRKVRTDADNWEIHYVDGETGQKWVLDYPNGGYHGGGTPRLRAVQG